MIQNILKLLFDQIADHPCRFCPQNIERIAVLCRILKRQQTNLWPVAVRNHQLVSRAQDTSKGPRRSQRILTLDTGCHGLPALQQGVAAKGCDHQHA